MNIEWYPGHIAKARREIKEHLKEVDIVIEIIDARCPLSSIDFLNEEIKGKKRLLIIAKSDLVSRDDIEKNIQIIKDKANDDIEVLSLDCRDNTIKRIVDKKLDILCDFLYKKYEKKGISNIKIKALVVGMPNVGKSTFINSYIRKKVNKVENTPGVTKKLQWAKVSDKIYLLDTPGVTVPKFVSGDVGINLALVGSINDDIVDMESLAYEFIKKVYKKYKALFIKRYDLKDFDDEDPLSVMDAIARNEHIFKKNNEIDYDRLSKLIITDFRKGRLGKISLE